MYLRKSIRSYKGGSYTNYLLVESIHTAKGPRQKTVCSLGDLGPRPRAEWLKLAHKIEDALVGQADLLDPADGEAAAILRRVKRRQASKAAAGAPAPPRADAGLIKVDPSRVSSERHREAGPVHVGYQFWRRLELDRILRECGLSQTVQRLACVMTLNRLIAPCSEHAMPDWIRRTALADILDVDLEGLAEDPLYQVLDKLHPHRAAIEAALVARERSLFNLDATIYLYDLTSTYFEGECARNGKAKRGYSRDHRADCKQVVVGLVVSREGFPITHEVFAGNTQDRTTLAAMLDRLAERAGLRQGATVVVDRGMAFDDNLAEITDRKLHYVVASRQPERDRWLADLEDTDGFAPVLRQPSPLGAEEDHDRDQDPRRRRKDLRAVPQRAAHRQGPRHPHQAGRAAARGSRQARQARRREKTGQGREGQPSDRTLEGALPPRRALLRSLLRRADRDPPSPVQRRQVCQGRTARRLLSDQDRSQRSLRRRALAHLHPADPRRYRPVMATLKTQGWKE